MRSTVLCYLLMQAALVVLWWLMIAADPSVHAWFSIPGSPAASLLAFAAPNLVVIAGGSVVAALAIARRSPHRHAIAWLVAGAVSHGAAYSAAVPVLTGSAWIGALLMLPAACASIVCAIYASYARI